MSPASPQTGLYHLILLRHGESQGNLKGLVQGQRDYPLSPRGLQQAQALANRWQREGVRFDLILSSPLTRAHRTAEIISESLAVPLELEPLWMERDNGLHAGLAATEIDDLKAQVGFFHPYRRMGDIGETQFEFYLRGAQAIQNLLHRPPGRYLIVSHGGILNMALYAMLGIAPTPPFQGPRFRFENSAFASFTYNPADHIWRMLGLNDRSHWLEAELDHLPEEDLPAVSPPGALPGLAVRQAGSADVENLLRLFELGDAYHRQAVPHIFQEAGDPDDRRKFLALMLTDPDTVVFIAEAGEERAAPVGALLARRRETPDVPILVPRRYAAVDDLVVEPAFRQLGIATALMDRLQAWARQQGLSEVELTVWEFNNSARRLYEKLGYQTLHRRMSLALPDDPG